MKAATRAVAMRFLGERGATAVEYGLMIALIAMAMFGTLYVLGPNLDGLFDDVADRLSTPAPPPPPAPGPRARLARITRTATPFEPPGRTLSGWVILATGSSSTLMVTGSGASSSRDAVPATASASLHTVLT